MAAEEAFVGAGQAPGLELWRIEAMAPVKQPEANGKFYSGDSYILLATTKSKTSNAMNWSIHFWLGSETSQDESGVAAYKTCELDDSLGGGPIQYREVQGHETDLFMSYFKKTGVEYLPGGVESGFNKVERDVFPTRLLQCKGKRTVRCTEVTCSNASLNSGDVFILDMGLEIFQWNGPGANRYEISKAFGITHSLHNDRGARGTIVLMAEDANNATFWGALGGQIEVTNAGEDDDAASAAADSETKLFHVDGDDGTIKVTEVPKNAEGRFTRDMLDSDDAYILDVGSKLYVWTGKTASKEEKRESMVTAQKFITDHGKPNHTQVERVVESGETTLFKSYFHAFDPPFTPKSLADRSMSSGVAGAVEQKEIDVSSLQANAAQADTPVDDGSGKIEIWRIEDFKKVEVAPEKYGQFYGGDSYILLYTYMVGPREEYIIYFWQGKDSSKDEKGASALLAKELDDAMGGAPVQVRVVQGKEPNHFRQLFKGKMIVHEGGKASGFKNSTEGDSFDDDGVSLFHVRGTNALNVFGIQVSEVVSALNSQDCFVLVTPTTMYSWMGVGSNDDEKASATAISEVLSTHSYGPPGTAPPSRELTMVAEGEEPDAFWEAIGGKGEYPKQSPGEPVPSDPRLFQCSNAFGSFVVEEVCSFDQEDLLEDDVYLLDVGTTLYAWIGGGANADERRLAIDTAQKYNAAATDGRDPDIPIIEVIQNREPLMFTQFFPGWDAEMWTKNVFVDPYEAKLAAQRAAAAAEAGEEPPPAITQKSMSSANVLNPAGGFKPTTEKFALSDLQAGTPEGVDPTKKEEYLSDADFMDAFKVDQAAYKALPGWKQKNLKRTSKLF